MVINKVMATLIHSRCGLYARCHTTFGSSGYPPQLHLLPQVFSLLALKD